jgi:biotin carboxylase
VKRVLFLMTTKTYRAGAFLDATAGLDVHVTVGSEEAHVFIDSNPSGHLTLDFHDLEQATSDIVEFAGQYPIDAIISTDDEGLVLAAMASDALGLSHNRLGAVATARNKYETRVVLSGAGLLTPTFWRFSFDANPIEAAKQVSYPCVVKPLALSASRGVMRANKPDEFVTAFQRLLPILQDSGFDPISDVAQQILVEGFIPGFEVAVEGILVQNELVTLAIFDKPEPLDGPYFEESIYVTPSRHSEAVQAEILTVTRKAIAALGLKNGPVHVELRVNDAGAWILEVAPRSIGGYCSRALRFGIDTSLETLIIQQALNQPLSSTQPATAASGVMMIPIPMAGILCEIQGLEAARQVSGVTEISLTISVGRVLVTLPEGSQYLGFIFARDETPEQVEAILRQAHEKLNFIIMSSDEI